MAGREPEELERRLQNVTERLLAAFEELDFVHSMAETLSRPEGITDVDGFLLRETLTLLRADGGWVARRRGPAGFGTTKLQGFSDAVATVLNQDLVQTLADRGEFPFLVDDLPGALVRQPGLAPNLPARENRPDTDALPRAFLAVALEVNTEILGVICLGKHQPGDVFTAGDSKLLSTLAAQAGMYMKNADLVAKLRAEAKSLGRRVQELESDTRSRPDLSWIRGPSPAMLQVAHQVEAAAATDATVLLLGESGTGKSLVARILHRMSSRASGSFVEVNCGAVPPGLIESELFGHSRGAFTGADRARAGLFEEADRGTILLDEVAELPLEAQVKLLTVLEQHKVRRVGENRDRTIDVRVIAATNADLNALVRDSRFREDLFYRLNVISVTVPPLRQRREDILHLAGLFLEELARETNRRLVGFSPEAERALLAHPWPGNVRELRNVIERSLLLKTSGDRVEVEDLPIVSEPAGGLLAGDLPGIPLAEAVRAYERRLILDALHREEGVVSRAAATLGISRTNLHNKLRKHDLIRTQTWDEERQTS